MPFDRRMALACVCLYAAAQILFLINIGTPTGLDFDESHYVPAAKELLETHSDPNREHPPLGKMLIAVGIRVLGDRPLGWRVMSTVFGSLTLVGMYLWALALFKDRELALWAALVTLVNHLLYVQSRIAMLDTFMFAFVAWALAAVTAALDSGRTATGASRYLALAGWLLGLATATKWFGVVAWALCLGLVVSMRMRARQPITNRDVIRCLVVYPLLAYAICFIPRLVAEHHGPWYTSVVDFLQMQTRMYQEQRNVPALHPYMSQWYQWPLLNRPMWYAFERDGNQVHGVLLLGNPLIMWGGVLALLVCVVDWLRHRSRASAVILVCYLTFLLSWGLIPRRLSLYYYYYPAAMTLSLALAHVLRDQRARWARWVALAAAAGVFVYFLPVLSGAAIGSDDFRKWMWFPTWI